MGEPPINIVPFPQTAAQINDPQTGAVNLPPAVVAPLTADDIRGKIVELFDKCKPQLSAYHDYAQQATALAEEYHAARFAELFPGVPFEELTLVVSLNARETPKSLDNKLAQIAEISLKRIVFDRVKSTYLLFA